MKPDFNIDQEEVVKEKLASAQTIQHKFFDPKTYEIDDKYRPAEHVREATTIQDLVRLAKDDQKVQIEARVMTLTSRGVKYKSLEKKAFCEAARASELKPAHKKAVKKFTETMSFDAFAVDSDVVTANTGLVGDDFVPLLGGPFHKNLPYYDYLRMHSLAFHAFHHDPIAKRVVNTIRDFTLGRGWRVDTSGKDKDQALAVWRTFEEVNDLYSLMNYAIVELCTYGEIMVFELPDNETKLKYKVSPGQEPKKGSLPRYRLIDPSTVWEIVTYPEDITRVLYYQQVFPTQYQMYTGQDAGEPVPGSKFIVQQLPGKNMLHFKVNCVSNEKRGRSILFPVLGYLKRLRDSVNYSIISDQKNSSWAIDTTIEGSQSDINQYVSDQTAQGTIPPAGSEFVHTDKIKREYRANAGQSRGQSSSFEWCLSMIAAGIGLPISYLNTHLSGGQTRASAVVATEPVAKMFEHFQFILEMVIRRMAKRVFEQQGLDADIEVTFPEIITQDRSQKLKDLQLAQLGGWITKERAATVAAKELGFTDFEWSEEQSKIIQENEIDPTTHAPLSSPGSSPAPSASKSIDKSSAVTSNDKKSIKKNDSSGGA